ncbi:MAG TPA: thioredoxin domain-containing protein [Fimbriimonadaceae bacterium]|nr:thioredoxin domain-containing protein [Fimbriimonadaceae bacterium]
MGRPSDLDTPVLPGLPTRAEVERLPPDGGAEFNRLIFEASPYLLQHARRPLDWYPWGAAAFEKAAAEDKPIFLSVGYATCHWCHVMEHECFNDPEVAAALNAGFVPIKVDREERPDVDHVYMTATQALTGSGGWPNTLLLTPDRKPFFAGTYIPKPHLLDLLERADALWKEDRAGLTSSAEGIASGLEGHLARSGGGPVGEELLRGAADALLANYDRRYGGFGQAPKFPTPLRIIHLIRSWKRFGKAGYLEAATGTLRAMRLGGIYDQLGFGLHRYSTDATWTVPHFEKMLYDQALAALAYLEAFEATREPFFAQVVEEILTYVDRDLSDPAGGFHSAEDADSEGIEGKCYVWTEAQVREVLGEERGLRARARFELSRDGNFHEPGLPLGSNVLRLDPMTRLDDPELAAIREELLAEREKRIPPLKDDKGLCDWNGLMLAAFARAGAVLGAEHWTERASRAADFLLETMKDMDGGLLHTYRLGKAQGAAGAQDYAFLLCGLVELVKATGEPGYLRAACGLADRLIRDFWDSEAGGFFMSPAGTDDLFVRAKEIEEGAIPSGNGVAALALTDLTHLTAEPRFGQVAEETLEAFGKDLARTPYAYTSAILALGVRAAPTVVVVGDPAGARFQEALTQLRSVYSPGAAVLPLDAARVGELDGFLAGLQPIEGSPAIYVCRDGRCELPTQNVESALKNLV